MENSEFKYCGRCGAKMPGVALFCPQCGSKAPTVQKQASAQGSAAATTAARFGGASTSTSAASGVPFSGQAANSANPGLQSPSAPPIPPYSGVASPTSAAPMPQSDLGMNWYKFIIWFWLFAAALMEFGAAITLFTGGLYGGYASYAYAFLGGLRALDMIFAVAFIALAVMALFVRQQLAGFKRGAPRLLYAFIAISCVASLIYLWGLMSIISSFASSWGLSFPVSSSLTISTTLSVIIGCAIWLVPNYIYFTKREHLFVK